nr:MAG TPA: hypothetical protein [Caudoviricetes sp.]
MTVDALLPSPSQSLTPGSVHSKRPTTTIRPVCARTAGSP